MTDTPALCGAYVGDNDATCPQLTCVRPKGHEGLHDNVKGDGSPMPTQAQWDTLRKHLGMQKDESAADVVDEVRRLVFLRRGER